MNRRRRHHPIVLMLMALAALIALQVAVHIWPLVLLGAVLFVGCRRWQWHQQAQAWIRASGTPSAVPVIRGQIVTDDAEQLRAENDQLRARPVDAHESAQAAWDAAASAPPQPARGPSTARDRLLADRLGGVHDLFRSDQ